jgi:hypothetical protein
VEKAATALADGNAAGFAAAFDPKIPGLAALRAAADGLLQYGDVQSSLQFGTSEGGTLDIAWELRIREREGSQGLVLRKAQVKCRVAEVKGTWRIAGFEPRDFFAVPHVDGAWNILESAAVALDNGDAAGFLHFFERSTPGYYDISRGANSMVAQGVVEAAIDMTSNEGTDTSRTIQVDWTLHITDAATGLIIATREQEVTCRVELVKDDWRIAEVRPVAFFAPFLLGTNFPHDGDAGGVLGNRLAE